MAVNWNSEFCWLYHKETKFLYAVVQWVTLLCSHTQRNAVFMYVERNSLHNALHFHCHYLLARSHCFECTSVSRIYLWQSATFNARLNPIIYFTAAWPCYVNWLHSNFHTCTLHLDVIKVFYLPTEAQYSCFKRILKFTLKQLLHVSV